MKFLLLGLGGWISSPSHDTVAVLVQSGSDLILLDCGEGVVKRLQKLGVDITKLSLVVVTHSHGDHSLSFPTLVIWLSHLSGKVKVLALDTVVEDLKMLVKATRIERHLERAVEFISVPLDKVREPTLVYETEHSSVYAVLADHSVESIAIKIVEKNTGKSLVYTGDTRPCDRIVQLARDVDVLIHEASCLNEEARLHGHSTVQDAIKIAEMANVKLLIPVHYYVTNDILVHSPSVRVLVPTPFVWYEV